MDVLCQAASYLVLRFHMLINSCICRQPFRLFDDIYYLICFMVR